MIGDVVHIIVKDGEKVQGIGGYRDGPGVPCIIPGVAELERREGGDNYQFN
jgi:hypothetical protein